MANYPQQSPPGMLGTSPNYSYAQSFAPPVSVSNPTTGMAQMANALINGYMDYLTQPKQGGPTQLSGAVQQPNVFSMIGNLFSPSGSPAVAAPVPDPTTGALY